MGHSRHVSPSGRWRQTHSPNQDTRAATQALHAAPDGDLTWKTLPVVLDTGSWGHTIAGLPHHACDLIATLVATSLVRFSSEKGMNLQSLLILTDTPMESRLLVRALDEAGLTHCQVRTYDNLPADVSGAVVIFVSATSDNSFRQVKRCLAAGARLSCVICNVAAKGDLFRDEALELRVPILQASADSLCTLAGSTARWVSLGRGLPQNTEGWVPAVIKPVDADLSTFVLPRPDHTVWISRRMPGSGGDAGMSVIVDLPDTMNLFLLEGLDFDPFYVAATFHTCNITSDLDGLSFETVAVTRGRADAGRVLSGPTIPVPCHQAFDPKVPPAPKDRSRHYEDDQWYDTEAQKEAQECRRGRKFSRSDIGVQRQGDSTDVTLEQTLELLKRRGTAGEDE